MDKRIAIHLTYSTYPNDTPNLWVAGKRCTKPKVCDYVREDGAWSEVLRQEFPASNVVASNESMEIFPGAQGRRDYCHAIVFLSHLHTDMPVMSILAKDESRLGAT